MSLVDYFQTPFAYDPLTNTLVANASFTVHLPTDGGFASPLAIREPESAVAISDLRSNAVGALPEFAVENEPPQVILRSGTFTTMLTSVYGAVRAAGLDPETVRKAIAAGADSETNLEQVKIFTGEAARARDEALAVGSSTDAQMAAIQANPSTLFAKAQNAAIAARVEEAAIGSGPSTGFIVTQDLDWDFVIVADPQPAPDPLSAPTFLSLVGGKNKATATWQAPSPLDPIAPITDYAIRYRIVGETVWTYFPHPASDATTLVITGLGNGPTNKAEAQVAAINAGGIGAWSNILTVTPGAVNDTVFRDPGTRTTAAELVGTSPNIGPETWTGANGQFEIANGYIVAKAGAPLSLVGVGVGAHGLVRWEGVVNLDTSESSATVSTRIYAKLGAGTTDVAYLTISVNAAGTAGFTFTCVADGKTISNTFGMPAGAIPAKTAAADYAVLIEQTSATTYAVTINGVTRTVTLSADPGITHANASRIGLASTSPRFKHKINAVRVNGYYN